MNQTQIPDATEERILVLAPSRKDGPTVAGILEKAGLRTLLCPDLRSLCGALEEGAGAALIAEEALHGGTSQLISFLDDQPPWSEPPVILVSGGQGMMHAGFGQISSYGNLIVLERPLRSATLITAINSALRARRRQYQVRDHLREREQTEKTLRKQEAQLRRLNETLEQRVRDRTAELEEANRRLLSEMQHRQQVEQALRHAQKMEALGQITGGVAHDFNNLLMVVSGGLDLLERSTDPKRRERILAGMRQAAARGEALTRQLLAFARRMDLSPEPVNVTALLHSMGILVAGALRKDIAVDIRTADDLWPAMVDPAQLDLAVLNTAVNARDAMPNGGTLTIEARNVVLAGEAGLNGEFVRLEIRDTGSGIPSEIIDRVFDPFFTTKEVGKGTGLGLSQVYGFSRQSGGHAEIQSRPGKGTSVILYLPRAEAEQADVSARPKVLDEREPGGAQKRVLLVEDDDAVAAMVREMLEGLGFQVERVASAPAALAKFGNGQTFDIVFSDIVMPGGVSGIELAKQLKLSHPEIPVVLTTGYRGEIPGRNDVEGLRILQKPYDLGALREALATAYN